MKRKKMSTNKANRLVKFLCYLLILTAMLMCSLGFIGIYAGTDLNTHLLLISALFFLVLSISNIWAMRKIGVYYLIAFVLITLKLSWMDNIIVEVFQPFIIFAGFGFSLIGVFNLKHMS